MIGVGSHPTRDLADFLASLRFESLPTLDTQALSAAASGCPRR